MSKRNDSFGGEGPDYVYIPVPASRDRTTEPGDMAGAAGCLVALPLAVIWFVCAGLCTGLSNFIEWFGFPILALVMMLPGLVWLVWRYPKSSAAIGLPAVVLLMYCAATLPNVFLTECLSPHGVLDLTPPHSREVSELTTFKGLRFPTGVREVNCRGCPELTSLEGLPIGVKEVDCSECPKLTSLKGLPAGVQKVRFSGCGLTSLAGLPIGVKAVTIRQCNGLTNLKELPASVERVDCIQCSKLTSLQGLSAGVKEVFCWGCPNLTSLEGLPASVTDIWCYDCPKLVIRDNELPAGAKLHR